MNDKMTKQQKNIMFAICAYAFVWLMYHITMVTKTYIGFAYPEVSDTMIANLVALPNLLCIVFSFLIGPIMMRDSKVKLAASALVFVLLYCVIFYFNGMFHGPFWLYILACCFAGYGQGCYVPLLNGIINDHFSVDEIGNRIANYNVAINIGAVVFLQVGGWIASSQGGTNWYNAYILGIFVLVSLFIFLYVCKKNDVDVHVHDTHLDETISFKDIPKKILFWVVVMGFVHCLFYVTQYAFNLNVSNYIITEYQLGTAAQAGTATSLVRFSLVIFTLCYPLLRKVFKDWMIPAGYLLVGVGIFCMYINHSLISVYLCAILIGLATSLAHSTLYAKAAEFVPDSMIGLTMSISWGVANIGSSFSVYILNFLAGFIGNSMNSQLFVGILLSVIASGCAIVLYVRKVCKRGAVDYE